MAGRLGPGPHALRPAAVEAEARERGGDACARQDPDAAPSDGPNMVPLKQLEELFRELIEIDAIAKRQVASVN